MGRKKLTKEEFIKKAVLKHGVFYDYSKVVYVNSRTKVEIICPVHGCFYQTPNEHLDGKGCKNCGNERKSVNGRESKEAFVCKAIKVFPNYNYNNTVYVNSQTKTFFVCPVHGQFQQKPNNLLNGHGCPKCGIIKRTQAQSSTNDVFIEKARKIHGNFYDYSKVVYKNNHTKVCIICPEHGEFWQTPNSHLAGQGCTKCVRSNLEKLVACFLKEEGVVFEEHKTFEWLKYKNKLHLDFYLPEKKIAIECQGRQHFSPIDFFGGTDGYNYTVTRDTVKKKLCEEHGIEVVYFTDIKQEDIICDLNDLKIKLNETK